MTNVKSNQVALMKLSEANFLKMPQNIFCRKRKCYLILSSYRLSSNAGFNRNSERLIIFEQKNGLATQHNVVELCNSNVENIF